MKIFLSVLIILISIFSFSCEEVSEIVTTTSCVTMDDCPENYKCVDSFCKKDDEIIVEECLEDSGCADGFVCNSSRQCVPKLCDTKADCGIGKLCVNLKCVIGCESNADCSSNQVCNTERKLCEEDTEEDCRLVDICEAGYECNQMSGKCVVNSGCTISDDCAEGYECLESQCIAKVKCTSDDECSNGEVCRADEYCGPDTGCDSDAYCESRNAAKPACSLNSGLCYECTSDDHCTSLTNPICNTLTHVCGNTENPDGVCELDSDCGLNKRCNTAVDPHECVDMITRCESDNDCQNGMHCDTSDGRCVMCIDDSQCVAPKECNPNTNLCEEDGGSGGTGTGNQICIDLTGQLVCILSGGTCDYNDDCITPDDPCAGVSCPSNSTCNDGYCDCDAGYHVDGDVCTADSTVTCTGVTCPSNAHCEIENNEAGCYCDTNYHVNDAGDACVADDPCSGVTCSNHGTCSSTSGSASCICDAGYHVSGLNCIADDENCDPDALSDPLNSIPLNATTVSLTTYNNLSLRNEFCTYEDDWYKVQLYSSTEFKANLVFSNSNGDIDIKLFKQDDLLSAIASGTTVTDNESITYNVAENGTYYIKVYILSSSNTLTPSYSMTLSTRSIQAGNPGAECEDDLDCYGTNSYCVSTYTSNGYCTSDCSTGGATCMDSGVCGDDDGNCFKSCTIGNDSTCGRTDLTCIDGGTGIGGICIKKCTTNSECDQTGYCQLSTGTCEINYTTCDDDPVYNSGCDYDETCFNDYDGLGTYCYPNNGYNEGQTCVYANDCNAGYGCIGNDTNGWECTQYCDSDYQCDSYDCVYFTNESYGYCY